MSESKALPDMINAVSPPDHILPINTHEASRASRWPALLALLAVVALAGEESSTADSDVVSAAWRPASWLPSISGDAAATGAGSLAPQLMHAKDLVQPDRQAARHHDRPEGTTDAAPRPEGEGRRQAQGASSRGGHALTWCASKLTKE